MYRKIVKKIISCTTVCTLILGMSSVNFDTAYAENGSGFDVSTVAEKNTEDTKENLTGNTSTDDYDVTKSGLPVVYINTEDNAEIASKEDYIDANLKIQDAGTDETEGKVEYDGVTKVKGHGNSTWRWFPKKAYKLKLDKKTSLFGMGKNKHWLLLANYIDETQMRNALSSKIGKTLGVTAMDTVWVEVVINGKKLGTYQLCEQVRISKDRADTYDWEDTAGTIAEKIAKKNNLSSKEEKALSTQMEEDLNWMTTKTVTYNDVTYNIDDYYEIPNANGGFLMEIDNNADEASLFYTDKKQCVMFKNPEFIKTNETVFNRIKTYMQNFENATYSIDGCIDIDGVKTSYTQLCNFDSLVAFWFASEIQVNEFGGRSTYVTKEIDGGLTFGPIWDYDFSSGSVAPFGAQGIERWTAKDRTWFSQYVKDPYFVIKARELYMKNRDFLNNIYADGGLLDGWHDTLKTSATHNESMWFYSKGFEGDFATLKQWMKKRLTWINEQFGTDASAMKSFGAPVSKDITVSMTENNGTNSNYGSGVANTSGTNDSGSDINETSKVVTNSDNAFHVSTNTDKVTLNFKSDNKADTSFNYYINGKYIDNVKSENNEVVITIPAELLTNKDSKNVVTVWAKDANGNLTRMNYATVNFTDKQSHTVTFEDEKGIETTEVLDGDTVYMDYPKSDSANRIFVGWTDGTTTYDKESRVVVKEDIELAPVWEQCADGGLEHTWKEEVPEGDDFECSTCGKTKLDKNTYKDITKIYCNLSLRYSNSYTGGETIPTIDVYYDNKKLTKDVDYTISFRNDVNVGYATYTIKGIKKNGFKGTAEMSYRIIPRAIYACVSYNILGTYEYTGKPIEAKNYSVRLINNELNYNCLLTEGVDYTVTYQNNVEVGEGTAILTGFGNFNNTKNVKMTIIPAKVKAFAGKANGKNVTLSWNKSEEVNGYNVYRRTTSTEEWTKIANVKDTSYVDSDVKEGKTYSYAIEGYTAKDDKTYVGKKVEIEVKNTQETTTEPSTTCKKPITTAKPTTSKNTSKLAKTKLITTSKKNNSKKISISFKKVKGAKKYTVQISATKNFKKVLVKKTVKKTKVSITSSKVKKKKVLYVRVKAVGAAKWSKPKKVRIKK